MTRKRTHINEELFGPYLYHGSPNKIPVGGSVVPQADGDDDVHATEDITYASEFGEYLHKVVPHDWSEIEPWEHDDADAFPDLIKPDGNVMQSFDSKKGFKVIGYAEGMGWKPGMKHPERKID
jgi:hypothetical protein